MNYSQKFMGIKVVERKIPDHSLVLFIFLYNAPFVRYLQTTEKTLNLKSSTFGALINFKIYLISFSSIHLLITVKISSRSVNSNVGY